MSWGGRRAGAGRPKKIKSDVSPSHSIRAKLREWEVIKPFSMLVKMGYIWECEEALKEVIRKLDKKYADRYGEDEETFDDWYWRIIEEVENGGKKNDIERKDG
ncbi:MAG: hypothetical protein IKR34_05310 [Candidatus Gastranaerophilales bacterium]|nr:hypothetical protein [Candidatus Gastranaerophilales bacterium]